jgi:hypothetical protein
MLFVVAALLILLAGLMLVSKRTRRRHQAADDDWNYVQVRRSPVYLEASLDRNLQWVVFEPNGEVVQRTRLLPVCRKVPNNVHRLLRRRGPAPA